jgi:DHA3 family multidrug efflux protein-like MFS transporter
MRTEGGEQTWGWLLGEGEARGIALLFFFSGILMAIAALLAFRTRSYRQISEQYATAQNGSGDAAV